MALYNALFGENEHADYLLKVLLLNKNDIPRYRDCLLHKGEIIVYTKTGGGNRETYQAQNKQLESHHLYSRNEDCPYDKTYANFYFQIPYQVSASMESELPAMRWADFFKRMNAGGPFSKREEEANQRVMEKIAKAASSPAKIVKIEI